VRRRSTQAGYSSSFFKQNTGSGVDQALTTGSDCLWEVRIIPFPLAACIYLWLIKLLELAFLAWGIIE